MSIADRLAKLGLSLPAPAAPVANYVPYKLIGKNLYLSGMIPLLDGQPIATGKVGGAVSVERAQDCARQCVLNALAWTQQAVAGDFARLFEVVRLNGYIACTPEFTQHPLVMNGASDLIVELFGERGRHTRVAVGVTSLPLDVPIEIDFEFTVD